MSATPFGIREHRRLIAHHLPVRHTNEPGIEQFHGWTIAHHDHIRKHLRRPPSVVASVKRSQHILFVKPTFKIRAHQWNDPQDLSAKGGGFWFHKPILLRHHLDLYSEGELLALADVDRMDFSN